MRLECRKAMIMRGGLPGWLCPVRAVGPARLDQMPELREWGHRPQGRRFQELQTVPIGLKLVFLVTRCPNASVRPTANASKSPPLPPPAPTTRVGLKRSLTTCAD